jgi:hypothetical protein
MYLINSYKFGGGVVPSIDPDAEAFLTAAAITDPTITSAIDTLVVQLKADGIWTKMKAIYPFVGGTASAHKWNLKDPRDLNAAFRLTFFGGLTHNTNGITGNGTNGYFNTNLNDNIISLNSIGIWAYSISNLSRNADILLTTSQPVGNATLINPRNAANNFATRNRTTNIGAFSNTDSRGLFGNNRISSSTYAQWKNGIKNIINEASVSVQNGNYLGFVLTRIPIYSQRNIAFASISEGLSDTEAGNLYTEVQAFQTTLGRQV